MSVDYWKARSAADDFERYWNVQNKASLGKRWGLVESLAGKVRYPSILDAGCGIGNMITFTTLADAQNYLGIDVSSSMVERARALHPSYRFEVSDLVRFPADLYDLVVAHGFLLHQHDLFLKLYLLEVMTRSHLIFDVLVANEGYSRRSSLGYWTRVLGDEEYGFMKKDLEEEFALKEVKFGEWSGHREYYLSCRRSDAPHDG